MSFSGDTQPIPESVQIEANAEIMLHNQINRSLREYLVRRKIVDRSATKEEFEAAINKMDPEVVAHIKQTTRDLSRDLFVQMANDQHNIDLLKGESQKNKLTGLANKEMATKTFELLKTLPEFSVEHNPIAVVRLDLDGFKLINDQAGHPAGDEVLKLVGQKIKNILFKLRTTDLAIHFSGDEFGLILTNLKPGTQNNKDLSIPETVEQIIARVISSIEEIQEVEMANGGKAKVTLSASAGFKLVQYGDISNFSTIDDQAERASALSKNCKAIPNLKRGSTRIADADVSKNDFLKERSISEKEFENSKITGGFTRPLDDLLVTIVKEKQLETITPEMKVEAQKILQEAIDKIRNLG
jgi:diguanylate cyclase (GGDEF)-like protein